MRYLSVCSGIEAATVAWHSLGWQPYAFSEIEPFPSAVLKHHYPDVPNYGDMTALPERILSGEIEPPDMLCGGTPCQAFSVAGLRNSLDDHRGNLTLTFVEIANAIDERRLVRGLDPAIIFWENVPGVLSTKDNAFGCFLAGLAGESVPLEPPGGRWSNAGFIDGPQRAVAWRVLDAQYFGVAQRRRRVFVVASAREDFDPAAVLFEFDGVRRDTAPSREKRKVTPTITKECSGVSRTGHNEEGCNLPVSTYRMVAFGEHVDDGTASAMKARDYKDATDLVAQPIPLNSMTFGRANEKTNRQCLGVGAPGDPAPTLSKTHHHAVAQPMVLMDQGGSVMNTMTDGTVGTLRRETHGHEPVIMQSMAVRRLTPVECERLQGFPDNYTNIPWRNKNESPDGLRYKALGNSMAVPVMKWIGERIKMVDELC